MYRTFEDTGYTMSQFGPFMVSFDGGGAGPFEEWAHARTWLNIEVLRDKPHTDWHITYHPK